MLCPLRDCRQAGAEALASAASMGGMSQQSVQLDPLHEASTLKRGAKIGTLNPVFGASLCNHWQVSFEANNNMRQGKFGVVAIASEAHMMWQ